MSDAASWYGIDPQRLAWLVRHYTRAGDVVLDIKNHPSVARVAQYLRRHPAVLVTEGDRSDVRLADVPTTPGAMTLPPLKVALLLAGLSSPGEVPLDLNATSEAMHQWRGLLRPGGFLLVALPARAPGGPDRVSRRSTVVAVARAAGLRYHQHLPVLLVPLPSTEPRTEPSTAAQTNPALLDGRHLPVHMDVLAFSLTAIDQEAADA